MCRRLEADVQSYDVQSMSMSRGDGIDNVVAPAVLRMLRGSGGCGFSMYGLTVMLALMVIYGVAYIILRLFLRAREQKIRAVT